MICLMFLHLKILVSFVQTIFSCVLKQQRLQLFSAAFVYFYNL